MQPPLDARSQTARDNFLKLGVSVSPIPAAEDKEVWRVDQNAGDPTQLEHMESLLEDCQLALNTGLRDEKLIDRRLPSILFGAFAKMKRAHLNTEESDTSTADHPPRLYGQQRLLANVVHEGKTENVRTTVDYTLVYGRRNRMAVNLVILKENSLDMQDKTWEALTAMGTIQRQKKNPGDNTGIYGLHTNSFEWHFLHLGAGSEYSALKLSWDTDKSQIIGLLEKICKQAIDLATKN
ncbi:hypothetical protein ASPCAL04331 [Aspergillus calidoustus]|uniref:Fungal-type protein kinase domain-containing protein n=1 Tax=Aspergillus calidoustus TaxID=454130 RepID=A0A0U5FV51_ASPCI|nr:hypothetical protein ASPCAL04331 [Aspergillus calidoustus]